MATVLQWRCPKCDSSVENAFDVCWNCGTTREGAEDPAFRPAVERHVPSECRGCGYSLVGIDHTELCPECGTRIERDVVDTPTAAHPFEKHDFFGTLFTLAVVVVAGLYLLGALLWLLDAILAGMTRP
jgi:hypothetical protein